MLPSNGENGAMHMEVEKVANNDQSLLVSPVWSVYDPGSGQTDENGVGRGPSFDGDRTRLRNDD